MHERAENAVLYLLFSHFWWFMQLCYLLILQMNTAHILFFLKKGTEYIYTDPQLFSLHFWILGPTWIRCSPWIFTAVVRWFVSFTSFAFGPQEKLRQSQKQESSFTKLPIGSSHTASPTQPRGDLSRQLQKLNCFQCSCHITSKPEVIQIKVIRVQRNEFALGLQLFLFSNRILWHRYVIFWYALVS